MIGHAGDVALGSIGIELTTGQGVALSMLRAGAVASLTGSDVGDAVLSAALVTAFNAYGAADPQKRMSRKQCILNGGGCSFSVNANPKADGSKPLIELDIMSQVAEHALSIDKVASETGVDAKLIRAIMYMETTHGYYDIPLSWFGANKSILPMNINVSYWGDAFGLRAELLNPYNNIKGGALMIRAIKANMPSNSSIAQISTVYNNVNATTVSDYGARVSNIYNFKAWK